MKTIINRKTERDPSRIKEVPDDDPDFEPDDTQDPEIEIDPEMD